MGPSTLSEPLPAHSEQKEGVVAEVTTPRADRKGKHLGGRRVFSAPFPGRAENNGNIGGARQQGVHVFRQSVLLNFRERTVAADLTISRLTLQSSRIQTAD